MGKQRALVAPCSSDENGDDDDNAETSVEEDVEEEPDEEESSEVEQNEGESSEEEPNEEEELCEEDPSEEEELCEEDPNEEEGPYEDDPSEEEELCEEDPNEEEGPCKDDPAEELCEEDPNEEEGPCEDDPAEEGPCEEAELKEESIEETDEVPSDEEPSEVAQSSSDSDDGKEHQLNSTPSSSDKKRAGDSLECNAQKKQKGDLNSKLEFLAEFSGTNIQDIPKNLTRCDIVTENQESIGGSSKKRRSRWDIEPEAGGESVDSGAVTAKKRKTRWESDDTQLKLLGPLKLPDCVKGLVPETDLDPEIQKLKMQLCEINKKLMAPEISGHRLETERSPSPPPIYGDLGIRINTREARLRAKVIEQRQKIISELIQKNPTFRPPPDYKSLKFFKKLYIPVREYPGYNFIGLIMGPRGRTHKKMEKETGAIILLRGKGSNKNAPGQQNKDDCSEDLHVHIEATTQESLDAAVAMVEKHLVPIEDRKNDHKRAQLRELAVLNETLREDGTRSIQKSAPKTNLPCEVCGDASHSTTACPLTARTPGTNANGQQAESLTKLGSGLFSPFIAPPVPTSTVPWLASPASGVLSSYNNKPVNEVGEANLYVGYIPHSVDDNKLIELFLPFGQICEARVIKDKSTGLSKGYGFVRYVDAICAAEAVARMNGYSIDGKRLAVRVAGRPPSTVDINTVPAVPQWFTHLPVFAGPAAIAQRNPLPMDWPGPQGSVLPDPYAPFPSSNGFLVHSDPLSTQSPASFGHFYQTPASSSLIPGGIASSAELAQFPGYLNSLDSPDLPYQMTPLNPGLFTQLHHTQSFGSK